MSSLLAHHRHPITGHAVVLPAPLHGHWVTMIVFAVKLVKERPGTVCTIPVVGDFLERVNGAIDLYFTSQEAHLRENIRVVQMGGEGLTFFDGLMPLVLDTFGPYFKSLVASADIECKTGKIYPGIRPPDVLILDLFFRPIIEESRTIAGDLRIPVYGWLSVNMAWMLRIILPREMGGYGNVAVEAPVLAKQLNKSVLEASYDLYFSHKGEVVNLPGLPPTYDYEFYIEQAPLSAASPHMELWNQLYQYMFDCDGVFATSDAVVEQEPSDVFYTWFTERNKNFYAVGPLIPKEHEVRVSEASDFLSKMQELHGEHSVLYFSCGTFFSPEGPALAKIMEVILDMGIPLVYSSAAGAKLPADLVDRLNKSDKVYTSSWVPQRLILMHKATGCFITHCGKNSFTEAISAGVPMIGYPLTVDQPLTAMYISLKFKIGYELMEIRTGTALRPAYRGAHPTGTLEAIEAEIRDVLTKAFGPDGEVKRRNIKMLRDKRNALWNAGGASRRNFERFIKENFPQAA